MLQSLKRVRRSSVCATRLPPTNALDSDDGLAAIWDALNVARDNKALLMTQGGIIINGNRLAAELAERPGSELLGSKICPEFFRASEFQDGDRWEGLFIPPSGKQIPVVVTRQLISCHLPDIEVYAVRDLRAHREAAEQRELFASRLEQQHQGLVEQEIQLRSKNVQLDAALNNIEQGVAMFDAEHRLVLCNKRYVEIYRLRPEQVPLGIPLRQIIENRFANGLPSAKSPTEIVESMLKRRNNVNFDRFVSELGDGRSIAITVQPMADGGTVTTHQDITESRKLHTLLEQQNLRFDAALRNMSQGLCMFDSDERLVVANDRYSEMYDLNREDVAPGTPFRKILESRIKKGAYVGDNPEAYIAERVAAVRERTASTKVQELGNGRVYAILHQPMTDGGWVATHQDITDQRRSEARIAHMALHDALTGLPNRTLLNERLEQALGRCRRGETLAVHLLDLDHFKNVNDTLGHPAGDRLLQMVGDRLRGVVRGADTIARMGAGMSLRSCKISPNHPKRPHSRNGSSRSSVNPTRSTGTR